MRDVNMLLTATDPDEEAIYTLMTILILTCPLEKEWRLVNVLSFYRLWICGCVNFTLWN